MVESGLCGEDRSFDHYARLVCRLLQVPTALVSIVETHRQVFPGAVGLAERFAATRETPLSYSFCKHVVGDQQPLIVPDARCDTRLADSPAVSELDVIAYAGWPLRDGTGRVVGSLCAIDSEPRAWTDEDLQVLQDLALACSAELRQAQRLREDSEQLARTIFGAVDVAMIFYDEKHDLVLANELAERLADRAGFRLDEPPYAGAHVRRADNRTPIPPPDQIIPRALRGDLVGHEMEWVGPPGRQTAVVASSQQVVRADGVPWGTLVAAHDVTDLARSLQVKDEFVATVSHELRTPLTSVLGYLELLEDELEAPGPLVAKALETMRRGGVQLQERIGELLDTADRRRHLDLRSTDVSLLAQRLASTFRKQARTAGVALRVEAADPHWAVVDARRIEQALENLVSNALKYTPSGGHVTVSVLTKGDTIGVLVTDTGVGMAEDEVAQAFNSFWRSERAHREAIQGFGIGLTLVQDIVSAHHGCVDITSRPGEGTTVTLSLPRSCDAG
ncbi:ATP-binding protein [Nocardioides sp. GCM10027113]|uniref:ATP-binding protein n=1 Tax=unclassified Nocardioides TaxID=2615069 RepID=UPI00361C15C4